MSQLRFFQSQRRRNLSPSKRRLLSVQPLEARRVLAASLGWDGPGLGSAELTYHIANSPSSLSQAETNAAIETALDAWSSAADITFTPTNQSGLRDSIDFSFTAIDGVGGTLAQAYFPDDVNPARIAGDVQFDLSDAWEVGNSIGNRAFDLVYVAVHEIGHSLGLDHAGVRGSVLAPFVSPSQSFSTLEASDVAAIQGLYAAADGVTTTETPVDEAPVGETPADETPTNETETDDTSDTDDDPFPRRRWRRGGNWRRWGGRLDAEAPEYNYVNPTNSDDSDVDVDETDRSHDRHHHHSGVFSRGPFGKDAESLVSRFDANDDAALSEEEVSERLWAKSLDAEVDADADGLVTLAELETELTNARQQAFNEQDIDADGVLTESEVSERLWARISAADGDADGGVSFDELAAFKAQRQADQSDADPTESSERSHHRRSHHRSSDAVFAALGRAVRRR